MIWRSICWKLIFSARTWGRSSARPSLVRRARPFQSKICFLFLMCASMHVWFFLLKYVWPFSSIKLFQMYSSTLNQVRMIVPKYVNSFCLPFLLILKVHHITQPSMQVGSQVWKSVFRYSIISALPPTSTYLLAPARSSKYGSVPCSINLNRLTQLTPETRSHKTLNPRPSAGSSIRFIVIWTKHTNIETVTSQSNHQATVHIELSACLS